jgi:hypothetical protein
MRAPTLFLRFGFPACDVDASYENPILVMRDFVNFANSYFCVAPFYDHKEVLQYMATRFCCYASMFTSDEVRALNSAKPIYDWFSYDGGAWRAFTNKEQWLAKKRLNKKLLPNIKEVQKFLDKFGVYLG